MPPRVFLKVVAGGKSVKKSNKKKREKGRRRLLCLQEPKRRQGGKTCSRARRCAARGEEGKAHTHTLVCLQVARKAAAGVGGFYTCVKN